MAYILKTCVEEFNDIALKDIPGYIHERFIDSNGEYILSGNTEDETIPGSKIIYDMLFEVRTPGEKESLMIINLEAQATEYLPYTLLKRGIYYGARLIDRQKNSNEGFQNSDFDKLKKVYSIWICMEHQVKKNNSINKYKITENGNTGYSEPKENYDLMNVIMIYLNNKYDYQREDRSLNRLLYILFGKDLGFEQKKEYLHDDYGILITEEEAQEVIKLSNLSLGIRMDGIREGMEKGIEQERIESSVQYVKKIMKNIPDLTLEQAMDLLEIDADLRETVIKKLK